jgi:Mu DNA-binding domain
LDKKLHSASEIAQMKLPGLPHTKSSVITRATREGWHFEEAKGVGGTKRLYAIPTRYLAQNAQDTRGTSLEAPTVAKVVGAIAAGSSKVDPAMLEIAMRALTEWEAERDITVAPERRPAVIAILYDYLQDAEAGEGAEAMAVVLRALG